MKTYKVQCKETGEVIEKGLSYINAKLQLLEFEREDKIQETYTPDFYEIRPMFEKTDVKYAKNEDTAIRYAENYVDSSCYLKRSSSGQCACGESLCHEYWNEDISEIELKIIICESCYHSCDFTDRC